jgi:hypothetical protein
MINTKIYLISEEYIKSQTAILQNVDNQFIKQHILEAQNIDVQQILGTSIYDEIIQEFIDFKDSGEPVSAIGTYISTANKNLVDNYLKVIILYYTMYYSIYDLYNKYTNKGIVNQTSDNSTTSDINYIEKMRKDYKNKAENLVQLMIEFIITNIDDYPLFTNYTDSDTCSTTRGAYSSLYLGKNI